MTQYDKIPGAETRFYRVTGITPILGTQPANPAIRSRFVASKAPTPELAMQEDAMNRDDDFNPNDVCPPTRFLRDSGRNKQIFVYSYTVEGFFKGALESLKGSLGIAQANTKVDRYLFVGPRILYLMRGGEPLTETEGDLERSLRAMTPKGPRDSLAQSEVILDPWELEFSVTLLKNKGTEKSKPLTWEAVEGALNYGAARGLGQWRNASNGRFIWEGLDVDHTDPDSGREAGGSEMISRQRMEYEEWRAGA